jgi:hypothetical protein
MYKLLIRADFDGKGLNKNTTESMFSNKREYKIPIFSTGVRLYGIRPYIVDFTDGSGSGQSFLSK